MLRGERPLHWAAEEDKTQVLKILLENHAQKAVGDGDKQGQGKSAFKDEKKLFFVFITCLGFWVSSF